MNFPINENDYFEYLNIETLEIPFGTEVDQNYFFHNFRFLRIIGFDPLFLNFINKNEINVVKIPEGVKEIPKGSFKEMYNLEYIEIPSSMEIIYENEFSDCININYVKCEPKFLKYFNMEYLTSIYIKYGEILHYLRIVYKFINCVQIMKLYYLCFSF